MKAAALVNYHNAILPIPVKNSFAELAAVVDANIGFAIEPAEGYRTKQEVIAELRSLVKYPDRILIDGDDYVLGLQPTDFDPPIAKNTIALRDVSGQEIVGSIPNYPNVDPRVTGRIIKFGPRNLINPTLLYFLVHNAGKYGFLHYGPKDPSIWYWRGDKAPHTYTALEVVTTFTNELSYLL